MKTASKQPKRIPLPEIPRREVPKEWKLAAGMLKGRLTEDPVAYQRRTRKEWDTRERRITRLVSKKPHGS